MRVIQFYVRRGVLPFAITSGLAFELTLAGYGLRKWNLLSGRGRDVCFTVPNRLASVMIKVHKERLPAVFPQYLN
jgi:hypothetical protein